MNHDICVIIKLDNMSGFMNGRMDRRKEKNNAMDTEQKEKILSECRELMSKSRYDESKTEQFCHIVSDILQEIIDNPGEREIKYRITKRLDRIEFRIDASGDKIDPLADGRGAEERRFRNAVNSVLFNPDTSVEVSYTPGWNHLAVKSPSRIANSKLLSDSMVKAMLSLLLTWWVCSAHSRYLQETQVRHMT